MNLSWRANTDSLVKKGLQRMTILHKLYGFNVVDSEMVNIYNLYKISPRAELWHSDLTVADLE